MKVGTDPVLIASELRGASSSCFQLLQVQSVVKDPLSAKLQNFGTNSVWTENIAKVPLLVSFSTVPPPDILVLHHTQVAD